MNTPRTPRKKNIVAVLAGVAVAAAVTASAASLGGISTDWLGANSNTVQAQIKDGLKVDWSTTYDATSKYYVVDDFTLSTLGNETLPEGAEIALTIHLGNTAKEFTGKIGTGGTVEFGGAKPNVAAHAVDGVSVVLVGGGAVDADAAKP